MRTSKRVAQKRTLHPTHRQYFTHVVTALDTDKPKPHPEGLLLCIDALKLDLCDCIMAGDSINDLRAGKAAGVRTIGFLSGLYTRAELELEQPDLVLQDWVHFQKSSNKACWYIETRNMLRFIIGSYMATLG